ncbi:hypothetical protein [Bacillus alkalicellulosilyticus]|uniref:hypothetical protein n=1 Tax=Alkalihalobacterium alkalicellulosilyticum TaxID=1912214 RepID=UPI0009987050|nr:hypothetical protein [Bacillus alkalicellulosilyticus]
MSRIDIRINEILQEISQIEKQRTMISSTRGNIKSVSNSLDRKIAARRNIGGRLDDVQRALLDIEQQLKAIEKFTNQSMTAYSNNEKRLVSLGKKHTLSRKSVKTYILNAFKGTKVKFTLKKPKVRTADVKTIKLMAKVYKVLNSSYIENKVTQAKEQTLNKPYHWYQQAVTFTTQKSKEIIPFHCSI